MIDKLLRLFLQPQTEQKTQATKKEMYHFILLYENEKGYSCTFRTYAANYQAAKSELLGQYPNKNITNISLKSKNLR